MLIRVSKMVYGMRAHVGTHIHTLSTRHTHTQHTHTLTH
jgi:hypothetical protein